MAQRVVGVRPGRLQRGREEEGIEGPLRQVVLRDGDGFDPWQAVLAALQPGPQGKEVGQTLQRRAPGSATNARRIGEFGGFCM